MFLQYVYAKYVSHKEKINLVYDKFNPNIRKDIIQSFQIYVVSQKGQSNKYIYILHQYKSRKVNLYIYT